MSKPRVISTGRSKDIAWRREGHLPLSPRGGEEIELHVQPLDGSTRCPRRGNRATHIDQRYAHGRFNGQPFPGKNPTPEQAKRNQCRYFLVVRRHHISALLFIGLASKVCGNLNIEGQRLVLLNVWTHKF